MKAQRFQIGGFMEVEENPVSEFSVQSLPRGGLLVEAGRLRMQIGAYPETIKDTMKSDKGVPDLYLLPDELFDTNRGVSNNELEFPVYFNFFIKGQRCRFLCHSHQVRPMLRVLREAIFGPFQLFLEQEYSQGQEAPGFPDMRREMAFYKEDAKIAGGRLRLKHMVSFEVFDSAGAAVVDGAVVTSLGRNRYRIEHEGKAQECEFRPDRHAPTLTSLETGDCELGFYTPPSFGVTVIGSGHGFDVESKTSGFILWIDGKGILVDPPVDSTLWMQKDRINPRLIKDLILTHCHADHDSGTLQKVLEEGRIRIHSTETVMASFVAKYTALTGLSAKDFRRLFEFSPLRIGAPVTIAGGRFLFRYTLHPIPTLGFEVGFEGESFYYSCDTLYDPDLIADLGRRGVLSDGRVADLLDVPWGSSLILHEAGIPPIHTPMSVLAAQPESVRARMYLTHVSADAIPLDSGLRLAETGAANTMNIPVPTSEKSLASRILDVVSHVDLFVDLELKKAAELLAITELVVVEAGEAIIERGSHGSKFFMIASGVVEVLHESLPRRVFFSRYDYIGETALILNQPRNADIVARTRTELLAIEREDFLRFVRGTTIPEIVRRLDTNRSEGARWTFEKNRHLSALTSWQMNTLLGAMEGVVIPTGTTLYQQDQEIEAFYLIDTGQVRVCRSERETVVGSGVLLGEFGPCLELGRHESSAQTLSEVHAYRIGIEDLREFFRANPGTFVRLSKSYSESLRRGQ